MRRPSSLPRNARALSRAASGGVLAIALVAIGCPRAPRPAIFAQVEQVRSSPEAQRAKDGSPALFAKAQGLERRAEEAWARGDSATAQLLGEHALAAYAHAVATARLGAAVEKQSKSAARRTKAHEQLEADAKTLADVSREVERLDGEVAVRREALAPVTSGKTDAAREAARWVAARANLGVAEALCAGAALLAPSAPAVTSARKVFDEVSLRAKDGKGDAPIDASTRARALCLKALVSARAISVAGGGPAGDALAEDLKKEGFAIVRDERGVAAVLPQIPASAAAFEPGTAKLTASGLSKVETLGRLAKASPAFAIVVIVHAGPGAANPSRDAARAKAVVDALAAVGADPSRIATSTPGAALPAYDPKDTKAAPGNERVEVVFVGH